jgi:hypothetical protein
MDLVCVSLEPPSLAFSAERCNPRASMGRGSRARHLREAMAMRFPQESSCDTLTLALSFSARGPIGDRCHVRILTRCGTGGLVARGHGKIVKLAARGGRGEVLWELYRMRYEFSREDVERILPEMGEEKPPDGLCGRISA